MIFILKESVGIYMGDFILILFVLCIIGGIIGAISDSSKEKNIKKVMIVGNSSTKKAGSAIARGAVGGALLGPVGLVGGAVSAKNKDTTTFLIEYKDGRRETKTVKNSDPDFKLYCKFLEM